MIISHQHKYLFVELPRTGSTAISRELRHQYAGVSILQKHATYEDFLKIACTEERSYFVFAGIRNPLDDAVSQYFKFVTGHHKRWTNPSHAKQNSNLADRMHKRMFTFVQEHNPDFPEYFRRYYKIPYNTWSDLSHKKFDYIIRFENLQDDFMEVLKRIGIEPKRALPLRNKTDRREQNYESCYTPEIIPRAKRVFGPYMQQWGYEFPTEWGSTSVPWLTRLEFEFFNVFRRGYWKYLRPYL